MKKIFTFLFAASSSLIALSQCDPMAHDFQGAAFGVYPPDSIGLQPALPGVPYEQVLYFKIPVDANSIDPTTYPPGVADIDSVRLTSITYNNGVSFVPISGLGLSVDCNPSSCMFLPNQQYCGRIFGTPNTEGVFPVTINVDAYATVLILGPQVVPYSFPDYVLTIGTVAVLEPAGLNFSVAKLYPNPATSTATLPVSLTNNEKVEISMMNLVGENVLTKSYNGVKGMNNIALNVETLESGVYLITVKSGNHSATQKFVVE